MQYGIKTLTALLFASSLSLPAYAENKAIEDAIVPPPPPRVQSGEAIEPEVNILQNEKGERVEQYSVNGRVYAVKITPSSGPAYYLIDKDGDGELETRGNDIHKGLEVPQWLLFSWN